MQQPLTFFGLWWDQNRLSYIPVLTRARLRAKRFHLDLIGKITFDLTGNQNNNLDEAFLLFGVYAHCTI